MSSNKSFQWNLDFILNLMENSVTLQSLSLENQRHCLRVSLILDRLFLLEFYSSVSVNYLILLCFTKVWILLDLGPLLSLDLVWSIRKPNPYLSLSRPIQKERG